MRALGWPDAFPAGDLVLRRKLGAKPGEAAEQWRPWRAYAAMHIWAGQTNGGSE
jgi:AraC family transcriptional regulator of adaptative response / DNA-3-methyladenine glycosylase II